MDFHKPILLVIDDPPLLGMFEILLKHNKYTSTGFGNPLKALDYFNNNHDGLSLIIANYNLPHMNGLIFSSHVRKLNKEVPIIIITTLPKGNVISNSEFNSANISTVLELPLELNLVVKTVEQFIKRNHVV